MRIPKGITIEYVPEKQKTLAFTNVYYKVKYVGYYLPSKKAYQSDIYKLFFVSESDGIGNFQSYSKPKLLEAIYNHYTLKEVIF